MQECRLSQFWLKHDKLFMELDLIEYISPNLFMQWYSEENKRLVKN